MFFVRFRNGRLSVRVSPHPTQDVMEAVRAASSYEWFSEDPDDGVMEEKEMMELAGSSLDFSQLRVTRPSP